MNAWYDIARFGQPDEDDNKRMQEGIKIVHGLIDKCVDEGIPSTKYVVCCCLFLVCLFLVSCFLFLVSCFLFLVSCCLFTVISLFLLHIHIQQYATGYLVIMSVLY